MKVSNDELDLMLRALERDQSEEPTLYRRLLLVKLWKLAEGRGMVARGEILKPETLDH